MKPLFDDIEPLRPLVIAGPCSAETERQTLVTAEMLADAGIRIFRAGVWKPRTRPGNFEGVGTIGLTWLRRVRQATGMKVATEVATAVHVRQCLKAGMDLLWIGARTTANPFAVQEIAEALKGTDIPVLVKNPLNPDVEAWIGAVERLADAGLERIGVVHRGFSGTETRIYRNAPEWRVPIEFHRRMPDIPIITDPSHISGKRDLVPVVARQAVEMGFDGLMIESHCTPDEAWSDARQQLSPRQLSDLLAGLQCRGTKGDDDLLDSLRARIDAIDTQLISLLASRMGVSDEIGEYKRRNDMQVIQLDRYETLMSKRIEEARALGLSEPFMRRIFQKIHEESVKRQL